MTYKEVAKMLKTANTDELMSGNVNNANNRSYAEAIAKNRVADLYGPRSIPEGYSLWAGWKKGDFGSIPWKDVEPYFKSLNPGVNPKKLDYTKKYRIYPKVK